MVNGHKFIEDVVKNGPSVIVCEKMPKELHDQVTYIRVENSAIGLGIIAANYFDNPSRDLKLVGITGTNGKTTVATLLQKLFLSLGYQTGLLSTIENKINDEIIPSTHTTPDPVSINQLLSQMIVKGCSHCFMEVSSHAIDQHRIAGLSFAGGIFTNITHEHLDYHKDFSSYLKAKKLFFDNLPVSAFALTNLDDKNGRVMLQNTNAEPRSFALKHNADFRAKIIENQFEGLQLLIDNKEVWFRLAGEFNAYNLLAAYATAFLLGEDKTEVLEKLSCLEGAEGRFDLVRLPENITGIIDYAHTPDALKNVLGTINSIRTKNEQLITVVGAGGDRDPAKRSEMGKISASLSNKVIFTSDNPRSEDPEEIIKDMMDGVDGVDFKKTISITNRREAIKTACMLAQAGDIILVAGKGHEKYQEIKGEKIPFDDKEVLRGCLIIKNKDN